MVNQDLKNKYATVQRLYTSENELGFAIVELKKASMFNKAAAAETVINDLFGLVQIQNGLINALTHDFLNQRIELDQLKQRAGL